MVGDINFDLLAKNCGPHTNKLVDLLDIYELHQMIKEPTMVTNMSCTLID